MQWTPIQLKRKRLINGNVKSFIAARGEKCSGRHNSLLLIRRMWQLRLSGDVAWTIRKKYPRMITYKVGHPYVRMHECVNLVPGTNSEIEGLTLANNGTNFGKEWD